MDAAKLIDIILDAAKTQSNLRSADVLRRAGLYQSAISRIRATKDCRFSTIEKLLEASGLTLVVVKDNKDVELLAKGELF